MKKILSSVLIVVLLIASFVLTGCDDNKKEENKVANNTIEISHEHGKGKFLVSVPKKDDGTPKYEFTDEKTENVMKGTFYLNTDTATFSFCTDGFSYNTATAFKAKNGEQKATFDGYLAWMKDPASTIRLSGVEEFEINGRKALRYYSRTGGSGSYEYYGYIYLIAADDIYPGSRAQMVVYYKDTEKPKEAKEFDEETLAIIKSFKLEANVQE